MDLLLCSVLTAYFDEFLAIYNQLVNCKPLTHMADLALLLCRQGQHLYHNL